MRIKHHIHTLKAIAEDLEPVSNARIAAMIVYRNRVISIGYNEKKTHPFQAEYAKNEDAIFWHAETRAIHNAKKKISENDLRKATLIICRVKSTPEGNMVYGLAKPCCGCSTCIKDHGVGCVIYTEDCEANEMKYTVMEND